MTGSDRDYVWRPPKPVQEKESEAPADFFSRWSRRKADVARQEREDLDPGAAKAGQFGGPAPGSSGAGPVEGNPGHPYGVGRNVGQVPDLTGAGTGTPNQSMGEASAQAGESSTAREDDPGQRMDPRTGKLFDELTDDDMPALSSLDTQSDLSVFLARNISPALRMQALTKVFQDPKYNVICTCAEYAEDYTNFTPLGDVVPHDLKASIAREAEKLRKRLLGRGEELTQEEAEARIRQETSGERSQDFPTDEELVSQRDADRDAWRGEPESEQTDAVEEPEQGSSQLDDNSVEVAAEGEKNNESHVNDSHYKYGKENKTKA